MNPHFPQKKTNNQITEKEMCHKPHFKLTALF